jgi:hypothetical protein
MGEKRITCKFLVGMPEGKTPLGRPRSELEDDIKIDLREIWCGSVDWIRLAVDKEPLEGSCEHGNEFSGSVKYWKILE